jgi:hypothetical protein
MIFPPLSTRAKDFTMDVPNTSCGECSVCCEALTFDIGGTRKLSGVMCPHCRPPHGCGVYDTRWEICRTYLCGWRHLGLPQEWRPDKSEILISLREGPAPDGLHNGIEFLLLGSHDRLRWLPMIKFIAALLETPQAVYLSIPGAVGYQSPWVYLNDMPALKDAIARRHYADTLTALEQALKVCIDYPKTALPEVE